MNVDFNKTAATCMKRGVYMKRGMTQVVPDSYGQISLIHKGYALVRYDRNTYELAVNFHGMATPGVIAKVNAVLAAYNVDGLFLVRDGLSFKTADFAMERGLFKAADYSWPGIAFNWIYFDHVGEAEFKRTKLRRSNSEVYLVRKRKKGRPRHD